jgi:hypothetical protein
MHKGTLLAVLSCALAISVRAQSYYLMSYMTNGNWGPPLPMNPCSSCPVYPQGDDRYWVDDRFTSKGSFSYDTISSSGGTNGISANYNPHGLFSPMDFSYTTNGSLWIEALSNDTQNVYLQLHNTTNAYLYQIFSATNLDLPITSWIPGQAQNGDSTTNVTLFSPVPMTNGQTFFRGEQGNTVVFANVYANAYETNATLGIAAQLGSIQFLAQPGINSPLTVHYSLGGSAQNGIDYTSLSGVATIPGSGNDTVFVYVQPISPTTLTNPIETVDFAVQPDPNYLVAPLQYAGTVLIKSSSTTVGFICPGLDAVRPSAPGQPAQNGALYFFRQDDFGNYPPLTFYYQMSGTASNGVDYQLLSGSLTFAQDSNFTNVSIVPFAENPLLGNKTVTLTVVSSNGYVADSNDFSCTMNIDEQTNTVAISSVQAAINSAGPPGEPAQEGVFNLSRSEPHNFFPEITVGYSMSGQAVDGVDYTALSGTVTFPEGVPTTNVPIDPINHWTNASKTVVMTLSPSNSYAIDPNSSVAMDLIKNSSTQIEVVTEQQAFESSDTNLVVPGIFSVVRSDTRGFIPALTVFYNLSGTATNGVDYTNLSGAITFAADQIQTNIYIQPLTNRGFFLDGTTVTISLIPTNYYFIDPNKNATASLNIGNGGFQFQTITNLFPSPVGIEYDPYLTNLIVSQDPGDPTFVRLGTNITVAGGNVITNLFMTNWSGIGLLPDEVYMTVVTNNASGFTNGDMFFGSTTGIGWLSSNAAVSNLSWCSLTNVTETNNILLRGGLCMDTVGTFSNNIVAVTSTDDPIQYGTKGVWEVDSRGNPRLLAHIDAYLLEGIAVIRTNFGPWSGKIITGDEITGTLYLVDTNGTVTSTNIGIHCESIQIIPPDQSLHLCDPTGPIFKVSKDYFRNYAGDLLVEDGGENGAPFGSGEIFIFHWDATSGTYIMYRIKCPVARQLEHCVFAPIDLPAH